MSFLQELSAKFRPQGNQQGNNQQANANVNGNQPNQNIADPNNLPNAGNSQNPAQPNKPADPLAPFAKMFDNVTTAEAAPGFTLDTAQLKAVADSQDFTKGISPELFAKAQAGDSKALIDMMNAVGQNAYMASLGHSGRLTESFVTAREQHSSKGFSSKVKSELTANALVDTPNFTNPVVRQQLIKIAQDIQRQNPDASPADVAASARKYITELSNAINPSASSSSQSQQKNPKETNWDDFFGDELS